ncbi:MFS transporter [Pseudomonas aeruginosa]|nr:MFS transporter [Pseudomonas aeruginosa]
MVTTIAYPSLLASIIGFCLVGLGICTVIPLVAGAAARSSSMAPSSAIAAVLTIGFLGTLIGPPLIGFLSEAFGLRYAFGACVVLAIGIILRAERYRGKLRRSFDHALDRSGNLPHGRFAERYALLACRLR